MRCVATETLLVVGVVDTLVWMHGCLATAAAIEVESFFVSMARQRHM